MNCCDIDRLDTRISGYLHTSTLVTIEPSVGNFSNET